MGLKRIGIFSGGENCSGINTIIGTFTRSPITKHGVEVVGIEDGFRIYIRLQSNARIRPCLIKEDL